jgi:hypothetical protein
VNGGQIDGQAQMNESFMSAEEFYEAIRRQDPGLRAREERACARIEELTGYRAQDVGSFGLALNLPGSDLDLAIGVPPTDKDRVVAIFTEQGMNDKGERQTSLTTTRRVFEFSFEDIPIDIGVLPTTDFVLLVSSLERCRKEMTHEERVEHVWQKWKLKQQGRREEYAQLKLAPYARFCPSFLWKPIL